MKVNHIFTVFLLSTIIAFATACTEQDEQPKTSDTLLYLCSYQKEGTTDSLENPCEGNTFIKHLSGEGVVKYDSALNSYAITNHVEGTIDCIIVTLLCGENYSSLVDKEIEYSCDYYEYERLYEFPLVGTEIFVAKNIDYSVK
ncbi:hypothetical protein [Bernardetia sp.]|uniref:hypothetical protein n=1 Tax=Bernardetia sp. TaxID=1937974 RepID=UPI0025BD0BC3|nr:hypothetical protein [Bernardetia sp.]